MPLYPALDVAAADGDFVMAEVDAYSPVASEERDGLLTIFFTDRDARDSARIALAHAFPGASLTSREVDDEDWASRSQANLGPITVGRITITPPWASPTPNLQPPAPSPQTPAPVVIRPSLGFGTGHHPTTRLCLEALQRLDLSSADVLDVGTGSGVLAIAATALGARHAIGIDNDADAVQSARDNLALNGGLSNVRFECADLTDWLRTNAETADVVTANLTGATLARQAPLLMSSVRPSGFVVASGLEAPERESVISAFDGDPVWVSEEDGWVGLVFRKQPALFRNQAGSFGK
jgi:ribosomal protein L11 methyltransferase